MLKNYFKTAWRSLQNNRVSSIVNIGGLAIGMTVAMIIGLWIYDEMSFNTWHKNYNSIAAIQSNANYDGEIFTIDSHPMPLGTFLRTNYKSDFKCVVISTATELHVLSTGDKKITGTGNYMQPEAPEMLTLNMLAGSRNGLANANSIMLSQSLAKKLFNNESPVNKTLKLDNQFVVQVTGVYEDLPDNCDFKDVQYIAPFNFYLSCYAWARKKYTDWDNISVRIYAQVNPNVTFKGASQHIKNVLAAHVSGKFERREPTLFLQPMSRWHLFSKFKNGVNITSEQLQFIWLYGIIGIFVLLLACINFMNLSTARSEKRAKEVGIRKTLGSLRSHLVKQFFSESMVVAFIAFALTICLAQLCLPWFNIIAAKKITIPYTSILFWLAGIAFTLFTGLLAGVYPALYLSSFNPVKVLKGTFRAGRSAALPRKILVTLQFTVSVMLIIGTLVVYKQLQFAKSRPLGYNNNNLLQVPVNSPEFNGKFELLASELKNTGVVANVAASASPVTSVWSANNGFSWRGGSIKAQQAEFFNTINVTHDYGNTIGWQFTEGRDFSRKLSSDSAGLVLNEAAAKLMGLQHAAGETIKWEQIKDENFTVLGVVKDMVMESPFADAEPAVFFIYPRDGMNYMFIKLNAAQHVAGAIAKIEAVFKKLTPATPFAYSFANEDFNNKFNSEEREGKLVGVFAALAIVISCLGLFGLVSFVAEQRTKEIGVRKVFGASVINVWSLMSKEFMGLVAIALLIASPIAYYFMHDWLQQYPYRTQISWWIFAVAGAGALFITLLTVSWQSIKAALMNPVKSLRTE
jgi:ABC-type lipoprotein release transport system permease subunit